MVNIIESWHTDKNDKTIKFSWVTDIPVTDENVFTILTMLAFLIDQAQQLSCWLFQEALQKAGSKRILWERIRSCFFDYQVDSMETILRAIAHGFKRRRLKDACFT